jgi:hypothetical protein
MADNSTIVITGLKETIAGLKKFDQESLKKFNKVINDELRTAKTEARMLIVEAGAATANGSPLSHWQTQKKEGPRLPTTKGLKRPFPAWNTGEAVNGIVSSKAEGKVRGDYTTSAGALINKSRQGAIFEIAGRVPGPGTNASGTAFKRKLNATFGPASRVVYKIVDKDRLKIQAKFVAALEQAKADLQKALESQNTH